MTQYIEVTRNEIQILIDIMKYFCIISNHKQHKTNDILLIKYFWSKKNNILVIMKNKSIVERTKIE